MWSRSILARLQVVKMAARSSSSSCSVVHNLLMKKKVFKHFTSHFTGACFIHRQVGVLSFALPVLYKISLKGQIDIFVLTKILSELELELKSWSRSLPFFHGSGSKTLDIGYRFCRGLYFIILHPLFVHYLFTQLLK